MTMEEYFRLDSADLALIEEISALAGITSIELAEHVAGLSIQTLKELIDRNLDASCNAAIVQVSGNVIQVNFSARAAASWTDRRARQEPSKRLQFANRVSLMPITVPSTAPAQNSSSVSSTSPDTVIPYSSC
jgi:hypothetical protein